MMCAHCLEDARPEGGMMSEEPFRRAITLGLKMGMRCFVISDGEPTENPKLRDMCCWLEGRLRGTGALFNITSNGM